MPLYSCGLLDHSDAFEEYGGKTLIKKKLKKQTHVAISPIQYLKTAGLVKYSGCFTVVIL